MAHACNCVGPQNGEPKCPCMMRNLVQRHGRWVQLEQDLGEVRAHNRRLSDMMHKMYAAQAANH